MYVCVNRLSEVWKLQLLGVKRLKRITNSLYIKKRANQEVNVALSSLSFWVSGMMLLVVGFIKAQ